MSPARKHRERHEMPVSIAMADPREEGGHPIPAQEPMSPALSHRIAGAAAAVTADTPAFTPDSGADRLAASFAMRLQHDLRRLKEIQSIERKIAAKREMLPEYAEWVAGLVQAGREAGKGVAEDVLPTIMVWRIDTGDYLGALELGEHVIRYDVPLPARYNRTAPALIAEEIADAALKALVTGTFDLEILEQVEDLTCDADMHDQIRAKLHKAIGLVIARGLDADKVGPDFLSKSERALASLRRAQELDDRIGVKGAVQRIEKAIKPAAGGTDVTDAAGTDTGAPSGADTADAGEPDIADAADPVDAADAVDAIDAADPVDAEAADPIETNTAGAAG